MKPLLNLARWLVGALAFTALACAQTTGTGATTTAPSSTIKLDNSATNAASFSPTPQAGGRFTDFSDASANVRVAVDQAQTIAKGGLATGISNAAIPSPSLAQAVAQASSVIVQDGRIARANVLAERQSTLLRLRLAQSQPERQRLIDDLRSQAGQRMDEQRETARLVRDRLRELRDSTSLTRPGGS